MVRARADRESEKGEEKVNEVLFIEGYHATERPADIPESWVIYNAPRPLLGHAHWQGPFRHGVFYAAVAPEGDSVDEFSDAPLMRERNRELDGHVCVWVSRAQVMEYGRELAEKYGLDLDRFEYEEIVRSFLNAKEREGE